ncbi:MAG: hypothetical protein HYV09_08965 [Deltaproteobacteria bacterium]|nr:hypothetical protein [Deltaproteobacteria bacterium]
MAFDPPVDIGTLAPPVQRVIGPTAPAPLRMMAARGAVPGLRPDQIATAVAMFARADLPHVDAAVREVAEATLVKLPAPILQGAINSADTPPGVLDVLATLYSEDDVTLERILLNAAVALTTVERLAREGTERITELVATNEERLLANPSIIKNLYMNKRTRMSTADRVLDLAVRNGKQLEIPAYREATEAIVDELIAAPDAEPTPDDLLFAEAQAEAERLEAEGAATELVKEDDEGKEIVAEKAKSLEQRIREMTVSQKIRTAMLGTAATRTILVRDKNRLVSAAVVRSPLLQENEAAAFAASRGVSDEVLRLIAQNGELVKSHQIKFNLVSNPKTPIAIALRLLGHLRSDELKKLAKSKNVSSQISKLAKQELDKKKPGT